VCGILTACLDDGPLTRGDGVTTYSDPRVYVCDPGNEPYVVKVPVGADEKMVVNEAVTYFVAKGLELPIPDLAIIRVKADLLSNGYEITGDYDDFIGFKLYPESYDLSHYLGYDIPDLADMIVNSEKVPGIICMDTFVYNVDRNNPGNLLITPDERTDDFNLMIIDHGHCFTGPNWDTDSLIDKGPSEYREPTHPLLKKIIEKEKLFDFTYYIEITEQLPDKFASNIPTTVQEVIFDSPDYRDAIDRFLEIRKRYLKRDIANEWGGADGT
jgi:hypothetical protein